MFYVIKNSDIFQAVASKSIQHFAHGANCWSTMGMGIARSVALRIPELYQVDANFHLTPEQRLGRFSTTQLKNGVHGYNLYTQFYPGPHAKLEMVRSSLTLMLENIAEDMVLDEVTNVGVPAMGCGIGGLDLYYVARVISEVVSALQADYPGRHVNVFMYLLPGEFEDALSDAVQDHFCKIVESVEEISHD